MIDIHTHIINNVDDGSSSLEESILLIKREIESGVDSIVCTPHYIHRRYEKSVDEIKKAFDRLKDEVIKQGLNVNLLLGQEIYYDDKTIEKLKKKELLTINDTNYVLIEFSFVEKPSDLEEIIYNFKINGYKVIIAHVERYRWIDVNMVDNFKKEGAFIQVNANSLLNKTTLREHLFVKKLLKYGLVDVIASDAHIFRIPNLDKALKKINNKKLFNFDFD